MSETQILRTARNSVFQLLPTATPPDICKNLSKVCLSICEMYMPQALAVCGFSSWFLLAFISTGHLLFWTWALPPGCRGNVSLFSDPSYREWSHSRADWSPRDAGERRALDRAGLGDEVGGVRLQPLTWGPTASSGAPLRLNLSPRGFHPQALLPGFIHQTIQSIKARFMFFPKGPRDFSLPQSS